MPLGSVAHIDFQLRHAGELVVFGAQRGYGLLDEAALDRTDPAGLDFRGTLRTLMVRDGAFTGLTEDAMITHAGVTYTIRDIGNARTDGLRALTVTLGPNVAPPAAVDRVLVVLPPVDEVIVAVAA